MAGEGGGDTRGDGRVVLVTGAASGLGESIAGRLSGAGDRVIVADLDERMTQQVADNLGATGRSADAMTVDVATEGEVAALIDAVLERHGRIDAIVCTSQIAARAALADCTDEEWDAVMGTALKGAFLCLKHGLPAMAAFGEGSAVLVSPPGTASGGRAAVASEVLGSALVELARRAAAEHAEDQVRVNVVVPRGGADGWEDACDAVAFLVSPTPASLTGSVLTLRSGTGDDGNGNGNGKD